MLFVLVVFKDISEFACVTFFPIHTRTGWFLTGKEWAHWRLSVEVSSSDPGSVQSITQSLCLWTGRIETNHSGSKPGLPVTVVHWEYSDGFCCESDCWVFKKNELLKRNCVLRLVWTVMTKKTLLLQQQWRVLHSTCGCGHVCEDFHWCHYGYKCYAIADPVIAALWCCVEGNYAANQFPHMEKWSL